MSDKHESILHELADALIDYFDETGAVNYIEQTFECKEDSSKSFALTMQKTEGVTPCQKLAEANEEIKKLQAENAELKKQSQWISVEDELPALDVTVSILVNDEHPSVGERSRDFNGCWKIGNESISWDYDFSFGVEMEVTHWMPLPTPPEGE